MYKIMTPGPTQVPETVRRARSFACTNPDLDEEFYDFYKETCELISSLLGTKNETLILDGEGILGLEAACASLTEPGDKVLVIDNGIYGKGFADFASMYGGIPELYHADYENTLDVDALAEYLKDHHDYAYATVVHCDTPSGMLNDISRICPLLKQYGILTIVDSVSGMFGERVCVDDFQIDLLCGGSQLDEGSLKLLEEKYSSREKKIDFHVLSVQIVQEIKGIIRLLKVMLEKENGNWDKVKEQNDEDKAGAGFTGRKIKAYDKLELTDEQQKVLATLRQNCVEETLWSAIAAFQNYPFRTSSGLPYQYKLKIGKDGTYNKELLIDRRENSKTLSWSSIKMAFQNCRQISGIVKRPKALGDIRGISYIYPLFWKFGLIEVPEEIAKKMGGE